MIIQTNVELQVAEVELEEILKEVTDLGGFNALSEERQNKLVEITDAIHAWEQENVTLWGN